MGVYLSTPKTDKLSEVGGNGRVQYGLSSMQGWRAAMEDSHAAFPDVDTSTSFFGVYDGHGGKVVAKFCAKYLHQQMLKQEAYSAGDIETSIQKAFFSCYMENFSFIRGRGRGLKPIERAKLTIKSKDKEMAVMKEDHEKEIAALTKEAREAVEEVKSYMVNQQTETDSKINALIEKVTTLTEVKSMHSCMVYVMKNKRGDEEAKSWLYLFAKTTTDGFD